MNTKYNVLVYLLLIVLIVTYYNVFNVKWDLNGDNAHYYLLAKSMLQGEGYVWLYSPSLPHTNHFPPGYPAILALCMLVLGGSIIPLKIVNGLFLLSSVIILYVLTIKLTKNTGLAFVVSVLLLLNSHLYHFATILMSEMPYLFFSALAFYLVYKLDQEKTFWKSGYFYGLLLSIAATYYIRSIGISLLAAMLLHFVLGKRWQLTAATFGGFVLLYLPWTIRNSIHGLKSRYFGTIMTVNPWRPEEGSIASLGEFASKMLKNFDDTVIKGFSDVLFPFINIEYRNPSNILGVIIGLLVLFIVLYGAWSFGKWRFLFGSYILANIGVFMLWSGGNESRYVVPLTPFLAFCFYHGMLEIMKKYINNEKMINKVPYVFLVICLFMFKPLNELRQISKKQYHPAYKNYFRIAETIKMQTPINTIVCCRKPGLFYVVGERFAVRYAYSLDDKELIRGLIKNNVDYVILEQLGYSSTYRYLFPAIQKNPELFTSKMHLKNPDTYLLKFDKKKAKGILSTPRSN